MISRKFITSSVVYTFSAALPTISSFLLLPYYTNTGLISLSDFGLLSLYITFSLFIQVIAGLSFDFYASVAYQESKNDPTKLKSHLASLNGYILVFAAAILLVSLPGTRLISENFFNGAEHSYRYLLMSALTGIFNAYFRFYSSILISEERPWRYLWVNLINFFSTVALCLGILYYTPLTLEGPVWGRFLSCMIIFIIAFIELVRRYGLALDFSYFKPVWHFCFPLMLTALFQWVLSYSDRFIIKAYLFNNQVALYDLAFRFTLLVEFLLSGLSSAMTAKVYGLIRDLDSNPSLKKDLQKYYSGFNLLVVLLIPLNNLALPMAMPLFIFSDQYNEAFVYFGIISASMITRSAFNLFIYPMYFHKRTDKLIMINGATAIVQVLMSMLLISSFQLHGAAIAMVLVKLIQLGMFFLIAKEFLLDGINRWKFIVLPVTSIVLISILDLFVGQFGNSMHLIHLAELGLVYTLAFIVYRKELNELFNWMLKQPLRN